MKFLLLSALLAAANASIAPPSADESEGQCTGLTIDFTRLQDVTKDDLNAGVGRNLGGRTYGVNKIVPVTAFGTNECIKNRHRLYEMREGVKVFGAAALITVDDHCNPPDTSASFGGYEESPLDGVPINTITSITGKTFSLVEGATTPPTYVPTFNEEEGAKEMAAYFGTTEDKIGPLELVIFPSYEAGDVLAYRGEAWVSDGQGTIFLYDAFISATTKEMISICSKVNRAREGTMRRLRGRDLQGGSTFDAPGSSGEMCGSCADQSLVTWTTTEVECPINSLYLNDTDRTTTCLVGNLDGGAGEEVVGPGIVSDLNYYGTYDCNSRESGCNANPIPTTCSDSISDVHYGVTETMKWFQDYLGVRGGLNINKGDPIKTASFVHFAQDYCNAFFTTQTNSLYFGDCDCAFWTPLTSVDVAAHELAHGITNYASGLVYAYQPGGLNEGYSDIVGATMEFVINDSEDTPDFNLGENLIGGGALEGFILRYMEDPAKDGKSIANVCDFTNEMNVHYTSGVPNLAFVSSARACEASGCGDLRGCVMTLGPLYMYGNIHGLTELSGYLDAASATCSLAGEYLERGQNTTTCGDGQMKQFVKDGWAAVGITLGNGCAASTTSGCVLADIPADGGTGPILACFRLIGGTFRWVGGRMFAAVGWLFSPFFN